ncbi:hypothetical protein HYT25_02415 [Candidatus Pacearchaeota archaeon]|nr:hypothetical protein [Candidatus Pacearchaeota archaeon]
MNKRGQFFIIISVIIIGLVAGLATITNSVVKQSDVKFYHVGEELKFESEKAIDYGISQSMNDADMKQLLTDFAEDYSTYSNADDFYYIFGTVSEITFAGLKKRSDGIVNVDFSSGSGIDITLSQGIFTTRDISVSSPTGTITVNGVSYSFTLNEGQNFFFIVSKEIEGNVYTTTNG